MAHARPSTLAIWLLALLALPLFAFVPGCSVERDVDLAVGPGPGKDDFTVHVSKCGPSGLHVLTFQENIGGSRTAWGVPIYWQIASAAGSRRTRYVVGRRPPGFVTTVPLVEGVPRGPGDFYDVDVDGAGGGPGFTFPDLRGNRALTEDYDNQPTSQLRKTLGTECKTSQNTREKWIGRVIGGSLAGIAFFLGVSLGLVVLRGLLRQRADLPMALHTQTLAAALALGLGLIGVWTLLGEPHIAGLPQNLLPRGQPEPGRLDPALRPRQRILTTFDSTDAPGELLAEQTFEASNRYVMYVGCDGTSVQVSEGWETPDVFHGVRTVAFCNPDVAVPSALDEVSPNGNVTLGVRPNGVRRWRVTVATP